jgi:uncharacterized protein with PQ loop repeat
VVSAALHLDTRPFPGLPCSGPCLQVRDFLYLYNSVQVRRKDIVETLIHIVDFAVFGASLLVWTVFIPQIRLLYRIKKSEGLSLATVWGSLTVQSLIWFQSLLKQNWPVLVVMTTSVICLIIILVLAYRYR